MRFTVTCWLSTFDECEELIVFDAWALHVDLQGQQKSEEELVLLVEPASGIVMHLEGHVIDDVGDAFAGDGALGWPERRVA